jgi:hypothetical protein
MCRTDLHMTTFEVSFPRFLGPFSALSASGHCSVTVATIAKCVMHYCHIHSLMQDCAVLTARASRIVCVVLTAVLMPAGCTRAYKWFYQDSTADYKYMEYVGMHRTDTACRRTTASRAAAGFQSATVQNGCTGAGYR